MEMYESVVNYIIRNGDKNCPVNNHQISTMFHTSEVTIRKHINRARCEGIPICSCSQGYYYSKDKLDIIGTIQSLNSRTIAVEKAISGLLTNLCDKKLEVTEDE